MVKKKEEILSMSSEDTTLLCNLTTVELYEREDVNSKIKNSYIAGFLYDPVKKTEISFDERRKKLKEVLSVNYSETKICEINKIPHYLWKKLLEEHDIDSFKRLQKSPLIAELYDTDGYENRRSKLVDLLLRFDNISEAAEYYKVVEEVILKYCMIFRVNSELIYNEKFKSTRYTSSNKKNEERLVKSMEIPNEILESVKANEEANAAEDVKAENKQEQEEKTETQETENTAKAEEEKKMGANVNMSRGGKKAGKKNQKVQEQAQQYSKEEWFEKIKSVRDILVEMFQNDYIIDSQITLELDFNKEYKIIKGIFAERHPDVADAFTRKRLENFLRTNYGDANILRTEGKDGENLVGFKHLVNILAAFRKYIDKFYEDLPLDEDGGEIDDAIIEFCSFSNMISREQLEKICKRYYGADFHKVRTDTSKEKNLEVKKYIQNYLKLFKYPEITKEEEAEALKVEGTEQNETPAVEEEVKEVVQEEKDDVEQAEEKKEEESVDKTAEKAVMENISNIQEAQQHEHHCTCGGNCTCKKDKPFFVKNKADIKKLIGTLEVMLETGSEFRLLITNAENK